MTEGQHKKTTTTKYRFKGIEWLFMNLPFVCYLTLLGVIYIYTSHSVEKKQRYIEDLKADVKDARWRYMELNKDIMYGSTQSQIEERVADLDLKPMRSAPILLKQEK